MRTLLMCILVTATGVTIGRTLPVGTLPTSAYADTEVVTNCMFSLEDPNVRCLLMTLELTATSSNNVEIAFGRDYDGDQSLSVKEIEMSVGWDSGNWFLRQGPAAGPGELSDWRTPAVTDRASKRFVFALHLRIDVPKTIDAAENGLPVEWTLPDPLPSWMFRRSWNMVRIAVRGVDAPEELILVKAMVNGTTVIVR